MMPNNYHRLRFTSNARECVRVSVVLKKKTKKTSSSEGEGMLREKSKMLLSVDNNSQWSLFLQMMPIFLVMARQPPMYHLPRLLSLTVLMEVYPLLDTNDLPQARLQPICVNTLFNWATNEFLVTYYCGVYQCMEQVYALEHHKHRQHCDLRFDFGDFVWQMKYHTCFTLKTHGVVRVS